MNRTSLEQRMQMLAKWILGHAVEALGGDNTHLMFRVGDHTFHEECCDYPSDNLIANLALAVDSAGYSRNAFNIGDLPDNVLHECIITARHYPEKARFLMARRIA